MLKSKCHNTQILDALANPNCSYHNDVNKKLLICRGHHCPASNCLNIHYLPRYKVDPQGGGSKPIASVVRWSNSFFS